MTTAIVDSSALIALFVENDADHAKAIAAVQTLRGTGALILIPPEVIAETLNLLGKMRGRVFAADTGRKLLTDPDVHAIETAAERLRAGLDRWHAPRDA